MWVPRQRAQHFIGARDAVTAAEDSDWRLTNQAAYLTGVVLVRRPYRAYREGWDHDHCEFCWAKFMEPPNGDIHEGYATVDDYRWICPQCFDDFQARFGWRLGQADS